MLQSAIGVRHSQVRQRSQGFTGDLFSTLEFFHGVSPTGMRRALAAFLPLAFVVPPLLILGGMKARSVVVLVAACAVQYAGLVIECWYFLAQANHPQNLYYQSVS